jgi:hypothetical protein
MSLRRNQLAGQILTLRAELHRQLTVLDGDTSALPRAYIGIDCLHDGNLSAPLTFSSAGSFVTAALRSRDGPANSQKHHGWGWCLLFAGPMVNRPLTNGFLRLVCEHIYVGYFSGYVVMPMVDHLPQALVAVVVGAIVIWLVESDEPVIWIIVPAFFYVLVGFVNHHWSRPPGFFDRLSEVIGALFPALACVLGGIITDRCTRVRGSAPENSRSVT